LSLTYIGVPLLKGVICTPFLWLSRLYSY